MVGWENGTSYAMRRHINHRPTFSSGWLDGHDKLIGHRDFKRLCLFIDRLSYELHVAGANSTQKNDCRSRKIPSIFYVTYR
ncbi:hypothetical protein T265_09291 [Opisthorchis viverrini]|uniref:Uncharacterized protein n=1 Tax=Opisthorchis viverrini TaxID=6198 RepID=A0A074Z6I8_OPIVI|nr:hypothetical protein T265_09291 [Opisthorchis viverrini]KER22668.1 hypothetical protein T265_09291 [Opisthorchis viverrini]